MESSTAQFLWRQFAYVQLPIMCSVPRVRAHTHADRSARPAQATVHVQAICVAPQFLGSLSLGVPRLLDFTALGRFRPSGRVGCGMQARFEGGNS